MQATGIKNVKRGCLLTASLLLVALALNVLAQGEPRYVELPNFHQVNSQLYRGAQPKPGGLEKLKSIGVKTVVNLRGEDDHTRAEGEEARTLGLAYYNIPLPEFSRPKDEEVQRVLVIVNAPENQPSLFTAVLVKIARARSSRAIALHTTAGMPPLPKRKPKRVA